MWVRVRRWIVNDKPSVWRHEGWKWWPKFCKSGTWEGGGVSIELIRVVWQNPKWKWCRLPLSPLAKVGPSQYRWWEWLGFQRRDALEAGTSNLTTRSSGEREHTPRSKISVEFFCPCKVDRPLKTYYYTHINVEQFCKTFGATISSDAFHLIILGSSGSSPDFK